MSKWKWIRHGDEVLRDIGVDAAGLLHNPNGYPEDLVLAAITTAEEHRHQRRQAAAAKGAVTRRRRHDARVYDVARRIADGGSCGPADACTICGRGLGDPESIHRGIGSECWQGVLDLIESAS